MRATYCGAPRDGARRRARAPGPRQRASSGARQHGGVERVEAEPGEGDLALPPQRAGHHRVRRPQQEGRRRHPARQPLEAKRLRALPADQREDLVVPEQQARDRQRDERHARKHHGPHPRRAFGGDHPVGDGGSDAEKDEEQEQYDCRAPVQRRYAATDGREGPAAPLAGHGGAHSGHGNGLSLPGRARAAAADAGLSLTPGRGWHQQVAGSTRTRRLEERAKRND